jgi:hypothetical protein
MGLGPTDTVDLETARNQAKTHRARLIAGTDPSEARNAAGKRASGQRRSEVSAQKVDVVLRDLGGRRQDPGTDRGSCGRL